MVEPLELLADEVLKLLRRWFVSYCVIEPENTAVRTGSMVIVISIATWS